MTEFTPTVCLYYDEFVAQACAAFQEVDQLALRRPSLVVRQR